MFITFSKISCSLDWEWFLLPPITLSNSLYFLYDMLFSHFCNILVTFMFVTFSCVIFSDVNVETPDKKSVMMYLMCLFKVLPHSDIPLDQNVDLPLSPVTPVTPESMSASANVGIQESKTSGVKVWYCFILNSSKYRISSYCNALKFIKRQKSLTRVGRGRGLGLRINVLY